MVEKNSALQSHNHQCHKPNVRLSELPDEILLLIMSFLTMKEAARISVLSHRWSYLWRCFPALSFGDFSAMKKLLHYSPLDEVKNSVSLERTKFLSWVNRVVEAHVGQVIDEFKVVFYLDESCQSDMNKWVDFASTKRVTRLELDFRPPGRRRRSNSSLPKWHLSINQHHIADLKYSLRSLCLRCIDLTSEDISCLLSSCSVLEDLCIDTSPSLTYIRASDSPLQLKQLEVSHCPKLKTIDIFAPKLAVLMRWGDPIELYNRKTCRGDISRCML